MYMPFDLVRPGTVFTFDGVTYLKTEPYTLINKFTGNAILAGAGVLVHFDAPTAVIVNHERHHI